jgi:LmbE family N-acetylglucosaminyl deacetylase
VVLAACRTAPYESHRLHSPGDGPRILCVVAHPDDEIAFAGTLYKTATLLGGQCDVVAVTNGEGGFKYATLAEPVYGVELTDEAVGRAELPDIRRRELLASCEVLGVSNLFLLGQTDHRYTQDPMEVLATNANVWDLKQVEEALVEILRAGDYGFVLTLAPTDGTHGHHKAATILALRSALQLPPEERPVLMCARTSTPDEPLQAFAGLDGFPITIPRPGPKLEFDRTQSFGYRGRLDYRVVVNWAIAEHRSQGTMQLLMNRGAREHYDVFDISPADASWRAEALFEALKAPQFPAREYGPSAGVGHRE